ncbi:MAG: thioredoxin family protein [Candidatus Pacearchaeota archaeon]
MNKKYFYAGIGILVLIFIGIFVFSDNGDAGPTGEVISESSELMGDADKVTIYFFWGDGCPHCATQKPYLEEWAVKYDGEVEIKMFETWKNSDNVPLFQEAAQAYGIQARGVPTTFICENHWVGFSSSMVPEMENYIQYCIENGCDDPLAN